MSSSDVPSHQSLFRRTLGECRELYMSSGRLCAEEHPQWLPMSGEKFVELMDDLHRALVLKVYVSVCEADRKWSREERYLAETLFDHLWGERLTDDRLRDAAREGAQQSAKLKWYSLVRPFDLIAPLRDRIGSLETIVIRLANIIARADGKLNPKEAAVIKSIQEELQHHLRPIPIDEPTQHQQADAVGAQAIEKLDDEADDIYAATRPSQGGRGKSEGGGRKGDTRSEPHLPPSAFPTPPSLEDALAELDALIGLARVKDEVRTLTNFLKLQQRRGAAGLPATDVSLHMVFTGNPGTGKTSVARVVGRIYGAMGILKRGHLVETDRSGLVAEYIGQTGPKTNAKINEALDGVLFIDEAYSLVARHSEDPYGHEAVQTLLKRAEDERERLVVILAGYPDEMRTLLQSNPGLTSRFSRQLHFDDYEPLELARIFASMCDRNHYSITPDTRAKVILGLTELHGRRDRHFGNGRSVRNLFEHAIRRMANRIAEIEKLSHAELTRLHSADIEFEHLPPDWMTPFTDQEPRFRIACPHCTHASQAPGKFLGQKVRCPKCQHDFMAEWGEVADT